MLDTLKIASDDTESGYIIINAADFDAETMERYEDDAANPLPAVSKLAAALAEITDIAVVREMQSRDERKSAASLYEARITALTAE